MGKNHVTFGGQTIIDLRDTTAETSDVANGKVFYDRGGNRQTGSGNYMDKVSNPTANDILVTDANGQAVDSGVPITSKMNTVPNATRYNVPQFDTNGQLTDSGVKLNDKASVRPTITSSIDWSVYVEQAPGSGDYKALGVYTTDGLSAVLHAASGSNQSLIIVPSKGYVDDKIAGLANPSQSVTIDANGKLVVGGRMGQFSGTTGLFAPNDREPRYVNNYALLMTDAKGMNMEANRALAIVSGLGTSCQSAPAGTTEYKLNNTYVNRIVAKCCENGYIAKDEASSTQQLIEPVISVTINGATFTPDSAADSSTPIIIKVANSVNPDSTITSIRLFGSMKSYATAHLGNGICSTGGGRSAVIGGGLTKTTGNDACMIGQQMYNTGNGNAMFGRNHIARKNRGFYAGTGHDGTNAKTEAVAALGEYSLISSDTAFVVGNGTSATNRNNLFEIKTNGDIYVNGTKVLP